MYFPVSAVPFEKVKTVLKSSVVIGISLLVGLFFMGFNPYVTNWIVKGHPLYPA